MAGKQRTHWAPAWLMVAAGVAAGAGALPYAGSWNDGSRLASVEAIVDHRTLAIDDSAFVKVPSAALERGAPPYRDAGCLIGGTRDKLFVAGHFYTDKPMLLSFFMAVIYQGWLWLGGPVAALRPDLFCLLMTWAASGVAYLATVGCLYALGRRLGLDARHCFLLAGSLAFASIAPIYARHVNNHVVLLGVMMALFLHLESYASEHDAGAPRAWRLVTVGALGGLGYALDLGLGPALLGALTVAVLWRTGSLTRVATVLLAALPCMIAHHALNYAIGGTLKPANAVPEYLAWEGSPFNHENLTGLSRHSPWTLSVYGLSLLYGKHGLLGYNLPMFLGLAAGVVVWRARPQRRPEIAFAGLWCLGGWLLYAVFSNNYGGVACSIRWFVPFLAAGYYLIALLLRERPRCANDLALLSAWGMMLTCVLWWRGPWSNKIPILFWPIQLLALLSWWQTRRRQGRQAAVSPVATEPSARAA